MKSRLMREAYGSGTGADELRDGGSHRRSASHTGASVEHRVYEWPPRRVLAHAVVCLVALIVFDVMRAPLEASEPGSG
jgi:hypothetical protein